MLTQPCGLRNISVCQRGAPFETPAASSRQAHLGKRGANPGETGAATRQKGAAVARPRKHVDGMARPLSFRLSAPDRAAFLEKVSASGLSPSDFIRECVLTNKTQVIARPKSSPERRRLLYHVSKAGNNLNQLAHRANAQNLAGLLRQDTCEALLHTLESIEAYLRLMATHAD